MLPSWSTEQVLALAPDTSSAKAGRGLAVPRRWPQAGVSDGSTLLWGQCQGSGAKPYQTVVDVSGPAYRCSCPSRKFPCKHAVGLLLLWVEGHTSSGDPPDWAATWQAARTQRAERVAAKKADAEPADPAASRRRADERAARVTDGLEELDRWLADQIRTGLSGVERAGYQHFDGIAARMVDAKAPAMAATLRRLAGVAASGDGWPTRLLEEYALLHLTVAGHRRLVELPADLAATVRAQVGYPVARNDVLATAPVRDTWAVLGMRDSTEDRVRVRRVWLRGETTGWPALVLSFATPGGAFDATPVPCARVDADLHFYPGASPLRCLVGATYGDGGPLTALAAGSVADAVDGYAAAVTANPWTDVWPAVLAGVVPLFEQDCWWLVDRSGDALAVTPDTADMWRLVSFCGGHPVTVAVEYTTHGVRPLSALHNGRLVLV